MTLKGRALVPPLAPQVLGNTASVLGTLDPQMSSSHSDLRVIATQMLSHSPSSKPNIANLAGFRMDRKLESQASRRLVANDPIERNLSRRTRPLFRPEDEKPFAIECIWV